MDTVAVFLLVAVIGLGWWSAIGAKARARAAARRACRRAEVAFIDELAFQSLCIGRGAAGRLCLKRAYGFEFLVRGDLRYAGHVCLQGQHVVSVGMEAHPFQSHDPEDLDNQRAD